MYSRNRALIFEHIKEHAKIYLFMIILFLTGIIFGAIIVNSMHFIQKQDLFFYLERFFGQIVNEHGIENNIILKESFLYHAKYLFLLFLLGLSVIGLPLIWVLLYVKGLVIGFSVGFLVNQLGIKGLLLASLSIAPQNVIIIPIYIIAGSVAMIFSLILLGKLFSRRPSESIVQPFSRYAGAFVLLVGISFLASIVEAYVANNSMTLLIQSLYE
ncbi:stage II sporulation protein M [Oceanobacillus piezotolerans]|uniref:Stage II sporulation protein M n=1 Tax=Oceanobacillus piezotolerans TaxID=2448030 RepID=A0A498DTF3_9BACI|nr:stage II sporulation protein M [Oceanobacillus piezotolerans]RLL48147.1 stage II sporulation protein M [Oceanobacillus piezotolerans]